LFVKKRFRRKFILIFYNTFFTKSKKEVIQKEELANSKVTKRR